MPTIESDQKSDRLLGEHWAKWLHDLHQVTGLLALRGGRLSVDERATATLSLHGVLDAMENEQSWLPIKEMP